MAYKYKKYIKFNIVWYYDTISSCTISLVAVHCGSSLIPLPPLVARSGGSSHDDIIKWKHFPRYWPFVRGIRRSQVNSPRKSQWRGALMFSLICVWMNSCINNREAGDLRHHHTHYDITVIQPIWSNGFRGINSRPFNGPLALGSFSVVKLILISYFAQVCCFKDDDD